MAKTLEKKYCVNCTEELETGQFNSTADQNNMFTIPFCRNSLCWRYGLLTTAFIPEKTIGKFRKDKNEATAKAGDNPENKGKKS